MLPNFLVIGAAKAGTTALYWYLAEHPAVFMSRVKETNYFAYGVDGQGKLVYGDPDVHQFPVKTIADYEALFADAGDARAVGEASPIYLECPQAPGRIRATLPDVRLVCCLRHPVERAYADYLMYLWRRGRRFEPARDLTPDAVWARPDSRWMDVSRYHAQLARYYETFPRDRIHVFLFDDLKRSTVDAVQDGLPLPGDRSLRSCPTSRPPTTSAGCRRAVRWSPSSPIEASGPSVEPWIPKRAADWVRRIRTSNMRKAPSLPPELRKELTSRFRDDILSTSGLIGRSLDHWL